MPGLPGNPPPAAIKLAVQYDSRADAGADRYEHHMPPASGRAERYLRPGCGVRIILDDHRHADPFLDMLLHGFLAPGEVRREQHAGGGLVDESRGSDTDGLDLVAAEQFQHCIADDLGGSLRARGRSRQPQLLENVPLPIDDARGHLGTPNVNPYRQAHRGALHPISRLRASSGEPGQQRTRPVSLA